MSRFIFANPSCLVNVDHIIRVGEHKKGNIALYLTDGKTVDSDLSFAEITAALNGEDHIVAVIPSKDGSHAGYLRKDCTHIPVQYLAVTASGYVRPIGLFSDIHEFLDRSEDYCGVYQSDELIMLKERAEAVCSDF